LLGLNVISSSKWFIFAILFLPSVVLALPSPLSHYATYFFRIAVMVALLIIIKPRIDRVVLVFSLLLLLSVLLSNVAGNLSYNSIIIDDLIDVFRPVIFFGCIAIGLSCSRKLSSIEFSDFLIITFLALTVFLAFSWLVDLPLVNDLYNSQGHRFSGLTASINYVWAPFVIVYCIWLLSAGPSRRPTLSLFFCGIFFFAVIFSGSRTGFLIYVIFLLFFAFRRLDLFRIIIVAIGVVLMVFILQALVEYEIGFVGRSRKILELMMTGDLESFGGDNDRWAVWSYALNNYIYENFIFGVGGGKSIMRFLDSQYLLSLFRYGIFGVIIELCFIVFLASRLLANRLTRHPFLLFFSCLAVASVTSIPLYETQLVFLIPLFYGILLGESQRSGRVYD
jgi:O-antigen ligase